MENDMKSIVETYSSLVYRIAYAHLNHKEDAEDVFQEVFLTYVKKKPVFGTEEQARAWFSRTTVNHCRLFWRTKERHQTIPLEDDPSIPDPGNEDRTELTEALSEVPLRYRKVLEMYYFTGLSTKEIASALRISVNAVRIRLNRGRKLLKETLEP